MSEHSWQTFAHFALVHIFILSLSRSAGNHHTVLHSRKSLLLACDYKDNALRKFAHIRKVEAQFYTLKKWFSFLL